MQNMPNEDKNKNPSKKFTLEEKNQLILKMNNNQLLQYAATHPNDYLNHMFLSLEALEKEEREKEKQNRANSL